MFDIETDVAVLDPIHDNRHQLGDGPLARESLAYMLQIPEEGIGGFIYTWVTGKGIAGAAVTLFGPGVGDEPIFDKFDGVQVSPEMDFTDWQLNGLHLRHTELLKSAHAHYKSDVVEIDYHFDALAPAYAYSSHADGCPDWIADDRFEQHGKVKGYVKFNGKHIEFNCFTQRDHSWGTRNWGVNSHWKWVHAQVSADLALHFWQLDALGRRHLRGFVQKDNRIAQVVDVNIDFEIDQSLKTKWLTAEVLDSAGRTTLLKAETYALFHLPPDPMITLFESPLTLTIDGQAGNGCCEFLWPNSLIEHVGAK